MKNFKIAVINGGESAEAHVSRSSARSVIAALKENFELVTSIELDKNITEKLNAFAPDVVFPILHGPPGGDGTLQGFLEILGYSYVGSNVQSSALAMDKIVAKRAFREARLPVADDCVIMRETPVDKIVADIIEHLGESVVVKPARQGSAIGVNIIDNIDQLQDAVTSAFDHDQRLLVEDRIIGREITVGVIDTDQGPEPFPVIEITTPEGSWYDFDHRYTNGWSEHIIPADISAHVTSELQSVAVAAHQALGCRDLSRADFIITDNDIYLLEVNTLPGMTPTCLYPDGAKGYGLKFPELVKCLVERAMQRSLSIG